MLIKKTKLEAFLEPPELSPQPIDIGALTHDIETQMPAEQHIEVPENLVQEKVDQLVKEQAERLEIKEKRAEQEINSKIEEAQAQAAQIVQEAEAKRAEAEQFAQEEANNIAAQKSELEQTIIQEKQNAYQEGFAEGDALIQEFKKILGTFQNTKKEILEASKTEIIALSLDIAKQILGREVSLGQKVLKEQIESAIKKVVRGKGKVQIFLNAQDIDTGHKIEPALKKTLDSAINLVFLEDANVEPGSCIIETKGGRYDANFKTRLDAIKATFKDYLSSEIPELEILEDEGEESEDVGKETSANSSGEDTMKAKKDTGKKKIAKMKVSKPKAKSSTAKKTTSKKTESKTKATSKKPNKKKESSAKKPKAKTEPKLSSKTAISKPEDKNLDNEDLSLDEIIDLVGDLDVEDTSSLDLDDAAQAIDLGDDISLELDDNLKDLIEDKPTSGKKPTNIDELSALFKDDPDDLAKELEEEEEEAKLEDQNLDSGVEDYKTRSYTDYEGYHYDESSDELNEQTAAIEGQNEFELDTETEDEAASHFLNANEEAALDQAEEQEEEFEKEQ